MLHGLASLRRLGLHGYKEAQLVALPPSVAATLQVKAEAGRVGGWPVGLCPASPRCGSYPAQDTGSTA